MDLKATKVETSINVERSADSRSNVSTPKRSKSSTSKNPSVLKMQQVPKFPVGSFNPTRHPWNFNWQHFLPPIFRKDANPTPLPLCPPPMTFSWGVFLEMLNCNLFSYFQLALAFFFAAVPQVPPTCFWKFNDWEINWTNSIHSFIHSSGFPLQTKADRPVRSIGVWRSTGSAFSSWVRWCNRGFSLLAPLKLNQIEVQNGAKRKAKTAAAARESLDQSKPTQTVKPEKKSKRQTTGNGHTTPFIRIASPSKPNLNWSIWSIANCKHQFDTGS